jgi:hypothetical protein
MTNRSSISELVEQVVRFHLSNVTISTITTSEDVSRHGDPLLRITVVFDSPDQSLEAEKVIVVTRQLRLALAERGSDEFPLVSFVSLREAKKNRTLEAA